MVTTSNIEPRQVAFSDPAHVICPNLVYCGGGWLGGKMDMKHGRDSGNGGGGRSGVTSSATASSMNFGYHGGGSVWLRWLWGGGGGGGCS